MSPERFEHLVQLTGQNIAKKYTNFRKSIPAAERFALTLRFLASGDSQKSRRFAFHIRTTTVSNIIKETCIAIHEVLVPTYLRPLLCPTDWMEIAKDFEEIWAMTNVIGVIDGKHIQIEVPDRGSFNIVLLAICDVKNSHLQAVSCKRWQFVVSRVLASRNTWKATESRPQVLASINSHLLQ